MTFHWGLLRKVDPTAHGKYEVWQDDVDSELLRTIILYPPTYSRVNARLAIWACRRKILDPKPQKPQNRLSSGVLSATLDLAHRALCIDIGILPSIIINSNS